MDFAFVDLIPGIEPIYTDRRPKPKTPPPPPKAKTPPKAAMVVPTADGGETVVMVPVVEGDGVEAVAVVSGEPAKPRTPSPFELTKHFPPEGAEVPFVKTFVKPASPKASPPKAASPKAASPKAASPKAVSPKAASPKASPPKDSSPKPASPKASPPKEAAPAEPAAEEAAPATEEAPAPAE